MNKTDIKMPQTPNEGILFVDHSKAGHSGHLGHALVEYAPGKILAFYPHCFGRVDGHSGDGWMEYKRSEDGGHRWSEARPLEYSKRSYQSFQNGHSVMCEKAVATDNGDIILFNLESVNESYFWEPLGVPTFMRSSDQGQSWSEAKPVGTERGRFSDAMYHQGVIYLLKFCNDCTVFFCGNKPEHHYELYVSEDQGHSFSLRSVLPFTAIEHAYGTMEFLADGSLIVYTYNYNDECNLDYVISHDSGKSWDAPKSSFFAKQIRNPQMSAFKNGFVLHGRSGEKKEDERKGHFVIYTSPDGIHWDEGQYLQMRTAGLGAYSNNLIVHDPDGGPEKLLIQASHAYRGHMTNIYHWWLS